MVSPLTLSYSLHPDSEQSQRMTECRVYLYQHSPLRFSSPEEPFSRHRRRECDLSLWSRRAARVELVRRDHVTFKQRIRKTALARSTLKQRIRGLHVGTITKNIRRLLFTSRHSCVCDGHTGSLAGTDCPAQISHARAACGVPSITLCTLAVQCDISLISLPAICQYICHHASVIARLL